MNIWTVMLPLTQTPPEAKDVVAGWTAFAIFIALAIAVALLGFSLAKHLKRVNFEEPADSDATLDSDARAHH